MAQSIKNIFLIILLVSSYNFQCWAALSNPKSLVDNLETERKRVLDNIKQHQILYKKASWDATRKKLLNEPSPSVGGHTITENFKPMYSVQEIQKDEKVAKECLAQIMSALQNTSSALKNDKKFILEIISYGVAQALLYASPRLKDDEEVVLQAISKVGYVIRYASLRLQKDKSFLLRAAKNNGNILEDVAVKFRNDKEIVSEAIRHSFGGSALQHASDRLKKDKKFIMTILTSQEPKYFLPVVMIEFLDPKLKNDEEIILTAIEKKAGNALKYASPRLRNNRNFVYNLLPKSPIALCDASDELRGDIAIVFHAINHGDGSLLICASNKLKDNKKLVLEALKRDVLTKKNINGKTISYASYNLRNNPTFARQVIKINNRALDYFTPYVKTTLRERY